MFQSLHMDGCFEHNVLINKVLIDELQRSRPLKRLSCTWEDNINMHLRQVGCVLPCAGGSVSGSVEGFSIHIDNFFFKFNCSFTVHFDKYKTIFANKCTLY